MNDETGFVVVSHPNATSVLYCLVVDITEDAGELLQSLVTLAAITRQHEPWGTTGSEVHSEYQGDICVTNIVWKHTH